MERNYTSNRITDLRLGAHGLHHIGDYRPGTAIVCHKGILWLTQSGDRRDYILLPGEQFTSRKRGKILIEAMRESALYIAHDQNNQVKRGSTLAHGKTA